jgi:cysteine desulfurase family protein (TIGR01976 family)
MVDTAIDAMAGFARSGDNANTGGFFAAAARSDAVLDGARSAVGRLLGADPAGVVFGPNMTTLTFAFTRAVARTLAPGDRVVGTELDHDANVAPWALACEEAGAEHVLAPFDPASGRLDPDAVIDRIDGRTRWVAVTGASNLLGTTPDLAPIIEAAHARGAKVFVDAVHLAPHRRIDAAALGADVLVTSPYKWYGPHAGVLVASPEVLARYQHYKVRPAAAEGPRAWETGTPSFEAIAAVEAAARYLIEEGMERVAAEEAAVFGPLLEGLLGTPKVTVWGIPTLEGRTPTAAFTVAGVHPDEVARRLAAAGIATWSGHSYAVEVVHRLGRGSSGGVVRAGVVRYTTADEVEHLLSEVRCIAASG